MNDRDFRTCELCLVMDIPRDKVWEFWLDGQVVHESCLLDYYAGKINKRNKSEMAREHFEHGN